MYPKDYKTGNEDDCYPDLRGQLSSQNNVEPDDEDDEIPLGYGGNLKKLKVIESSVDRELDKIDTSRPLVSDFDLLKYLERKAHKISRENDVRDYFHNKKSEKVHPLVEFIIYGDVDEIPHDILGEHYCSDNNLDDEQMLRLNIASAVQAYFEGKLHKNGYLFDEKLHKPQDLIK